MKFDTIGEIFREFNADIFSDNAAHAKTAQQMFLRESIALVDKKIRLSNNDEEAASVLDAMNNTFNDFISIIAEEAPHCILLADDLHVAVIGGGGPDDEI